MVSDRQRIRNERAIEMLLERADSQGYLTIEDMMEIFPNGDDDVENLSLIMLSLRNQGVSILDKESLDKSIFNEHDTAKPIKKRGVDFVGSDDTVGLYLNEMSRVALLSVEEEQSLAKRIEAGRAAQLELGDPDKIFSQGRVQELQILVNEGEQAWEHLIKANTRLVVSVAKINSRRESWINEGGGEV